MRTPSVVFPPQTKYVRFIDPAEVWYEAGWRVFCHQNEKGIVGSVHCVHEATGKILLFGLDKKSQKPWPEKVLMTLCMMSEEKI